MNVDINDFQIEKDCLYKGERYSVRDNGAVLRHSIEGKNPRPTDNKWTFGKKNEKTGYMEIVSERIHRIVAFAFIGEPPSKEHVVDHIDTNRCNNRPENLQWLTKLENILKNPITVRKIEIICGSIEAFLANPSILRESNYDPNFKWMRTVTPQEAKACLQNMQNWAKNMRKPSGGSLGEWVYKPIATKQLTETTTKFSNIDEAINNIFEKVKKKTGLSQVELSSKAKKKKNLDARIYAAKQLRLEVGLSDEEIGELIGRSKSMANTYIRWQEKFRENTDNKPIGYSKNQLDTSEFEKIETKSITPNAIQRYWLIPSEFPCCPQKICTDPIMAYAEQLKEGASFARNDIYESIVLQFVLMNEDKIILVMTESNKKDAIKPWALAKIIYENDLYIHISLGSFFSKEGAEKQFTITQGLEWTGGDSIDDYC